MSGKTKPAGYTWFESDFIADEHVMLMTFEQEGIYRRLLSHARAHGSIPNDMRLLAEIVGKRMTAARMRKLWPGIAPCWQERDGRLINGRCERDRAADEEYHRRKQEAGSKGGRAKAELQQNSSTATAPLYPPSRSVPSVKTASQELADLGGGEPPRKAVRSRERELPGFDRRPSSVQGMSHIGDIFGKSSPLRASSATPTVGDV